MKARRYNANPYGPTGDEAAAMLGVSRRAIYRYLERGLLSYPITYAALQNVTRPARGPQRNPMSRRYTHGRHTFREK
jgi:hypothetical protein